MSALSALHAIHCANVIHGDIEGKNMCILNGEASIIDFSHSSETDDQRDKDEEFEILCEELEIDFQEAHQAIRKSSVQSKESTAQNRSQATVVNTSLCRSTRIRAQRENNEQVSEARHPVDVISPKKSQGNRCPDASQALPKKYGTLKRSECPDNTRQTKRKQLDTVEVEQPRTSKRSRASKINSPT